MAEKIKLADFDIDVDELLRQTQSVKQRIDEIKEEMKDMAKAGKTSSEAFINNAVSLKELNKEYNNQLKVLGEVASANGKVIPLEQQLDTIMQRETKTINDLRKQNTDLLKTRNNLNLENEEHQKLLVQINEQYDRNTQLIKANVSEREKEQMSVGGYANAIREAIGETGLLNQVMGQTTVIINNVQNVFQNFAPIFNQVRNEMNNIFVGFQSIAKGTEDMTRAQKLLTVATNATSNSFKLLRIALISTGIGAIVVALGSLVAYLTSTQEGIDKLNRVLTPLRVIFESLLGVVQDVGKALFDAFSNPRELIDSFLEAIRPIATVLEGIATFNWDKTMKGFEMVGRQMVDAARATADFFGEAWTRGRQIQALSEEIAKRESDLIVLRSEQNRIIKEENMIAEDITKSMVEREAAARKSIEASKLLLAEEQAILDLKIKQQTLENQSNSTTISDQNKLNELIAERNEKETSALELQTTQQNKLNQIRQQAQQQAIKAQDEAIKRQNDELDLFIAQQGIRARTLEQELELETQISERRRAILDSELKAKKISQEKYNAEVLKLNDALLKRQAEISVNNAQRELSEIERRVDVEREANKMVTQERFNALKAQEEELREARAAYEYIRLSEGLITEQEYQDAVRQIRLDSEKNIQALVQELKVTEAEQRELDYESQLIAMEEMRATQFEIESAVIEQNRERDLEAARQKYTDEAMLQQAIVNINAQADAAQVRLAQQANQAKWESSAQLAGALSNLLGQETAAGKAAAIAEATINTYLGATKALATLPPPASYIAMAATIASGLVSVARIAGIGTSTPKITAKEPAATASTEQVTAAINAVPPFATGGRVRGGIPIRRSNGDNVLATLKVGEVVLNERQQAALGGAATFRSIGVPGFATGGIVGSNIATVQNTINRQMDSALVDSIGEAVREGAQSGTATGAQQGIVDLSSERYIQDLASF